jgi:RNA polymerase sigma-B factor
MAIARNQVAGCGSPARAPARTSTQELFKRWHDHDDADAREELVRRFLPLARRLASRYHGGLEPLEDLVQVASLGLVKAIDRYDVGRAIAFSSFAVPTIVGELKRHFRDHGWCLHVPRGAQERALRVEQAQRKLTATTGRAPTFQQLATYLEIGVEDVLDALEAAAAHHAVSLDTPREDGDGEAGTLVDTLGGLDAGFERADAAITIERAAAALPERERRVLALRFAADQTQAQIAAQIGVSQMQISRILRRSVGQLREWLEPVPTPE